MGILSRFADVVKSNLNDLLDKAEDPAKMVEQTLLDAREDLAKVRKETAGVMADAKRAAREYAECEQKVKEYTMAAQNALKAGNEADARALLEQKQTYETNLVSLKSAKDLTEANAKKLQEMHEKLTRDIQTLEAKRSAIKAKVATAEAQEHMNDVVAGGTKAKASMETFDRMEEKADRMLDAAMAESELTSDSMEADDLLGKYSGGGDEITVDDELAKMKAELGL